MNFFFTYNKWCCKFTWFKKVTENVCFHGLDEISLFETGYVQRGREESEPQAVCCVGHGPGYHQTVFPCPGQGPQENIPRQEPRVAVTALCLVALHADYRLAH